MHKPDLVFEASWEICNKVGGIYTVVKSKAAQMVAHYADQYFLVGPYFPDKAAAEFSEEMPEGEWKKVFDDLHAKGIRCHYGRWLIEGNPHVILIDFQSYYGKLNEIKKNLYDNYQIDSLRAGSDYDEPVTWAYTVGIVIEALSKAIPHRNTVAHFHEWLAGAGLLHIQKTMPQIGTVFTTHATILGRTLAGSNMDLYGNLKNVDAEKAAYEHSIEAKFHIEKRSAQNADCFTTVSEITSMEAEHLLGRKADVLVLNGLDIEKFPSFEENAISHNLQKDRIKDFLMYYFYPYYSFDIQNTLFYFTAARYEFENKGIDVFIDSLADLNERLKKKNVDKTIVAFFFIPAGIRETKAELIANKTYYQDVADSLEEVKHNVQKNITQRIICGGEINKESLFSKEFLLDMRKKVGRLKRKGTPPLCTHDLSHDHDAILEYCNQKGLTNQKSDKVKVVMYPVYLNGADGLLNLNYYEAMQGCHLGVFPSYYEPWGYTPLEAGALGVASVTTDLSGFGRYFCQDCVQDKTPGIYLLKRLGQKRTDIVNTLTNHLESYCMLTKNERNKNKLRARSIAADCDWKQFAENYFKAHHQATAKSKERQ